MIQKNIKHVQENIRSACTRTGRDAKDVILIAVSKTKPESAIMDAYNCGIRDFGENKVQELVQKAENLPKDIRWHMIGHLQRNKVKYIVDKVCLIHSVDSLRLADEISKEALKRNLIVDVLVEVNVAEEETKYGSTVSDTEELVARMAMLEGIRIRGLMTIAPFVQSPEDNRKIFMKLKQLAVDIENKNIDNVSMQVLSMGMTGDYEVAVEEGASYVRVGTGVFGERDYGFSESK